MELVIFLELQDEDLVLAAVLAQALV